jgi:signal peptidase I
MTTVIFVLVGVVALSLLSSALTLWLSCLIFRVRRPTEAGQARIRFRRALVLTLIITLLSNLILAGGLVVSGIDALPEWASASAQGSLLFAMVLVILRNGLPAGWRRSLGVELTWFVLEIGRAILFIFVLREFLFEPHVVPTGAMAESILGHHKEIVCPTCGQGFAINASAEAQPAEGRPIWVGECTCPNCRQQIALTPRGVDPGLPGFAPIATTVPDPGWTGGDRILTGKGLLGPRTFPAGRLDLIVFHYPHTPPGSFPVGYVKRLIGLPGETIAIHRGKLFVLAADERTAPPEQAEPSGEKPSPEDEEGVKLFSAGRFRPIRKNPRQVLALLRLVHDNDHQASDPEDQEFQRWVHDEKSGWSASHGTTAFGHGGSADEMQWLRYRHVLLPDKPQLITDFNGYNTSSRGQGEPGNWVTDLAIECQVAVERSMGTFALELSRGPERFKASFDLPTGVCTLFRLADGKKPQKLDSKPSPMQNKGTYRVRFANVDDRLIVWVNDQLVFGDGIEYTVPTELVPVKENDLDRPVSIGSEGAHVVVRGLRVLRDTYYTTARDGRPDAADVIAFLADNPLTWRNLRESPVSCYYVRPGHFFVLGDNSAASADSRSWGLVPQEKLVGKVLLRYFPMNRIGRVD